VVLHQEVPHTAGDDEQDTLVQAAFVTEALSALGFAATVLPVTLNLEKAARELSALRPALVFNLVESLGGRGEFIAAAALLLETLGLPFTGASAAALFLTSHKLAAKDMMRRADIPTPPWSDRVAARTAAETVPLPAIIKHVWEHASVGITDSAVVNTPDELGRAAVAAQGSVFFERYIDGREFNIGLLETGKEIRMLPPAEICFTDYPDDKPKIVGYEAKWLPDSFEFTHTPVRHTFAEKDAPLLQELERIARRAWHTFGLSGYARIDFRVDLSGRPWVLEVNANPCLAPDAGFFKAAARAGYTRDTLIEEIVRAALNGDERKQPS